MKRKIRSIKTTATLYHTPLHRSKSFKPTVEQIDSDQPYCLAVSQFLEEMSIQVDLNIVFEENLQKVITQLNEQLKQHENNMLRNTKVETDRMQFSVCDEEPSPIPNIFQIKKIPEIKNIRYTVNNIRFSAKSINQSQAKNINNNPASCQKIQSPYTHINKSASQNKRRMLVPILEFNRLSQDHSQQIQELRRRKKELNVQSKTQRFNTQTSRRVYGVNKNKEKKFYYQDDDGELQEMIPINKVRQKFKIQNTEIKYLPGHTIIENLRKKPITELVRKTKKKRRNDKDTGDTCILRQSLTEEVSTDNQGLRKMLRKGITLKEQESHDEFHLRLPTVR